MASARPVLFKSIDSVMFHSWGTVAPELFNDDTGRSATEENNGCLRKQDIKEKG